MLFTAYHPQTDRATERVNQEIEAYLSIYCTTHPKDWLNSLTTMEFTHNNRRHAEQKHTPFELILGDNPISIPVTFQHTKYLNIEEKMKCMIQEREEAMIPNIVLIPSLTTNFVYLIHVSTVSSATSL